MIKKLLILLTVLGAVTLSCSDNSRKRYKTDTVSIDLDSIKARGKLIAVTDFNSTNYFIYRGEPMGFHFELLKSFSDHLGVDLDFRNSSSSSMVKSDYYALNTGKISQWDDIIKIYSKSIKWDWRLLASLICQESRFIPDVKSRVGAYGLMQVMPETGKNFGIDITKSPKNNILAGAKYIERLHSIFDPKIPDPDERTRFILAAYNAGPGHIFDAMKLAEKNGMDPKKWEGNVAIWLLKKSEPQFYNDAVVKNGFFKGKESVAFVNEVLNRYEHYKNIIPDNNEPLSYLTPKN